MHSDELDITEQLVRRLVDRQFPDYVELPIVPLGASGSTNRQYRLGEHLLVRMPRQPGGGKSIAKELRWTKEIGSQLSLSYPDIVTVGEPDDSYSERWSIVRWQTGHHPDVIEPRRTVSAERQTLQQQLAEDLARLILDIRGATVSDEAKRDPLLANHYRGGTLADHDRWFQKNLEACQQIEGLDLDFALAAQTWSQAVEAEQQASPDDRLQWFHGDIVAENLLLDQGRLTGLLDFGGLSLGDPTVDLHGLWEVLDAEARQRCRELLAVSDLEWRRGQAWALAIAMMTFPYYWHTMPGRIADRMVMAKNLLADAAQNTW